jgi:hypothetical protein
LPWAHGSLEVAIRIFANHSKPESLGGHVALVLCDMPLAWKPIEEIEGSSFADSGASMLPYHKELGYRILAGFELTYEGKANEQPIAADEEGMTHGFYPI